MGFTPTFIDGPNPQPILLIDFTFQTGGPATLAVCSENLDPSQGGYSYLRTYLPRVTQETFDAIQAMSSQGIDALPNVTIKLADADMAMFAYERSYGFMGATVTCRFVQVSNAVGLPTGVSNFSNELLVFKGVCESPNRSENGESLEIRAINRFNLSRIELPLIPIQRNCPKAFPPDVVSQLDGLTNIDSIYHPCRYSAQVPGGLGVGSFTACGKTRADCTARGMFNGPNGEFSFAGVTWDPPLAWRGKQYTNGQTTQGLNDANYDKYNEFAPMSYGNTFVNGLILNVVGDPNSTRGEVCVGTDLHVTTPTSVSPGGDISFVLWNDEWVAYQTQTSDLLFRWYWINNGAIQNNPPNSTAIWSGQGDPYGSLCVIMPIVPIEMSHSDSIPRVKVIIGGRHYPADTSNGVTVGGGQLTIHAYNVYHILRDAGFLPDDFDLASVNAAITASGELITFTGITGQPVTAPRYTLSLPIEKRRSLADIIQAVRASGKLIITPNVNGLLYFLVKSTLAEQQPNPLNGSSFASLDRFGLAASGYTAYDFTEADVADGTLKFSQLPLNECVNEIVIKFQDIENQRVESQLTYRDPNAYQRATQRVAGSFTMEGFEYHNQVQRCAATKFAELYYGNPRGNADAGGTWTFQFDTSFKIATIGLKVGDIVSYTDQQYGLNRQLMRINKIQPHSNFETASIEMAWHDDIWYTDSFGVTAPTGGNIGQATSAINYPSIGLLTATGAAGFSSKETFKSIGSLTATGGTGAGIVFKSVGMLSVASCTCDFTTPGGIGGQGAWYGQVPRGTLNGTNVAFSLDYRWASPFMQLSVNGAEQKPVIDGFTGIPIPNPDYTQNNSGLVAVITYTVALKATDWHYIKYFRQGVPGIPGIGSGPLGPPLSILITFKTAFTQGSSGSVAVEEGKVTGTSSAFGNLPFLSNSTGHSATTNTVDITTLVQSFGGNPQTLADFAGNPPILFFVGPVSGGGSSGSSSLDLYDVYLTVNWTDGTTSILHPSVWAWTDTGQPGAGLTNGPYAIDGDTSTFADINATVWGPLIVPNYITINGWM